jgi:hypothetical protein
MDKDPLFSKSFEITSQKIRNLLQRLNRAHVCGNCASQALTFHAATFAEEILGSAKAAAMFQEIADTMREHNNVPAPEHPPSSHTH